MLQISNFPNKSLALTAKYTQFGVPNVSTKDVPRSKNEIKVVLVIYKCIYLKCATFTVLGIEIGPSKLSLRSQLIATKIFESETFVRILASVEKACDELKVWQENNWLKGSLASN